MNTLNNLVGIKSLYASTDQPLFYLDDIEGMAQERLAQLATVKDGSGAALFASIKDSATRLMM